MAGVPCGSFWRPVLEEWWGREPQCGLGGLGQSVGEAGGVWAGSQREGLEMLPAGWQGEASVLTAMAPDTPCAQTLLVTAPETGRKPLATPTPSRQPPDAKGAGSGSSQVGKRLPTAAQRFPGESLPCT